MTHDNFCMHYPNLHFIPTICPAEWNADYNDETGEL